MFSLKKFHFSKDPTTFHSLSHHVDDCDVAFEISLTSMESFKLINVTLQV